MEREKITILPFEGEGVDYLLEIADSELGKGYLSREQILSSSTFTDIAVLGGEIIGFSCGIVKNGKEFFLENGQFPSGIKKRMLIQERIGITKSLAIRKDRQNLGVGTSLFAVRIENFRKLGAGAVLMPGWQYPGGTTAIDGIARSFGFRKLGTVKDYYYRDSIKRQYSCPVCGPPPCRCSAVIYFLELVEGNG